MNLEIKTNVCSVENLYRAMYKCKQNVMWKDSVAGFVKNGLPNCVKLHDQLIDGTYKIDKYTIFDVYEPKQRKIVSTRIKDRVFQRSLCDNYLTKEITRSFIYDNVACQVGKGTKFARDRLKCHLQRFYRKHGLAGYVLKCDLKNFFRSTPHSVAIAAVRKRVRDPWAVSEVERIIRSFNDGDDPDVGMGLGSQVTQLVELAVLDDLDHFIKEQLRIKQYERYNDDFLLIHESKEYLFYCRERIRERLADIGLRFSPKKTQIFPITQPIRFLGFSFRLTRTGKVVQLLLPEKVSHERRKLRRLYGLVIRGLLARKDFDDCVVAWEGHARQGDSYNLIRKMKEYIKNLWEGYDNVQFSVSKRATA